MSRYDNRIVFTNNNEKYKQAFETRGIKRIKHYDTPKLKYPTTEQMATLEMEGHTWTVGDRFYKLAYQSYGDATLWWVIAWFNQTPTEADVFYGDVIQIPFPLDRVLEFLDV